MANRNDIPIGRCNAISREELARIWGMSDRATRHTIAELRALPGDDGYAILSTATKPSGYWRSDDPAEIAAFIRETEARARNTFLALRDARRLLQRHAQADQCTMFEECAANDR